MSDELFRKIAKATLDVMRTPIDGQRPVIVVNERVAVMLLEALVRDTYERGRNDEARESMLELEPCLDSLRGDREKFRELLTNRDALLAKVCEYADLEAEKQRCEPWSIIGQIFGHGSGVSSAIYRLYRKRDEKGGEV